jgi:TolA-binding protein
MNQKIQLLICGLLLSASTLLSQNVTLPQPSPAATLTQSIGLTEVSVSYGRPAVIAGTNDRTGKIWGTLVPWGLAPNGFGNQKPMPWRAGANMNTVISFSTAVTFLGQSVPAGSYGLHMIPYENGKVTVILSKNTSSWGSFFYEEADDLLRVDSKLMDGAFTNVLTFEFIELSTSHGVLALQWENKQIPMRIESGDEVVFQRFRDELRSAKGFSWQAFMSAAQYCVSKNVNLTEATFWIEQSIALNKNAQNLGVKAAILLQQNKREEAFTITDEAAQTANLNQLNALGYQMLGINEYDKAIEYFKLNVKNNPTDANGHDSLGEAYAAKGDKANAIKSFQKSLSLNPPQFVKDNSIANLKKLGVDYQEKK